MKAVALAGGVGGAKLTYGLAKALPKFELTVVVNTGDDFEHLGLKICPDLDTVVYNLADAANPETGWGRGDESWHFLEEMARLGGPTWFRLGDRDLAMHVERTRRLRAGERLSEVTHHFVRSFGIEAHILPMTDDCMSTMVLTEDGELDFQTYFVAQGCEPQVRGFRFHGRESARPAPGIEQAIHDALLVILCPSNPWVSLDPILAVPGIREWVGQKPVIGVSPLVGGRAIKGPAAKMFRELGYAASCLSVAEHYRELLSGMVIDELDQGEASAIRALGPDVMATQTIMRTVEDRIHLAEQILDFGSEILLRR